MAIPKITGAQRDFSGGEVDEALKRADENPTMKTGARQLSNWRILSGGQPTNRPGRRALFKEAGRVEEILMSPGNTFFLVFGVGYLRVYNAAGTRVFNSTLKGDGSTAIPWSSTSIYNVSFAVAAGSEQAVYIAYADGAPANVPQILTWDGVSQSSTWTLATFAETVLSNVKQTIFNRLSPLNVTMQPSAVSGSIHILFSSAILVSGMIGTRMAYCGRQILITGVTLSDYTTPTAGPSLYGTATCEEILPIAQIVLVGALPLGGPAADPATAFVVGDVVIGSISGTKGIVTVVNSGADSITVQLLPTTSGNQGFLTATSGGAPFDSIVGPHGSLGVLYTSTITTTTPQPVSTWDDEVMNLFRGYPQEVFYDQSRLGFCNFPSAPSGVGWSGVGTPTSLYISSFGATTVPASAIFELAPGKSQVLFIVPGMESSEFVFCDNAIYYIRIDAQTPLQPGTVSFNQLSTQGCYANVKPQSLGQAILYMKQGGAQVGAIQAPGAYYRPYVVDNVSEFHSHLFMASLPIAIACPMALGQFEESYAYILLANGSVIVGRYAMRSGLIDIGPEGKPKIGWLPWTGVGTPTWISALGPDVVFTTTYAVAGAATVSVSEILDNTQYLDGAILYGSPPAALAPSGGQGPLWWLAGGTVTVMDLGTRPMGTYAIDGSGFLVPQFTGGENLSSPLLTVGQPWTAVLEPFAPDAPPGQSSHQRMFKRRVSRFAAYVSNSTGFLLARLFSGPVTRTSPALGTVMNNYRVTAYNQDDDATLAPPLREEAQRWRPLGRSYDPRMAIIKDTPGPLLVHEVGLEVTI